MSLYYNEEDYELSTPSEVESLLAELPFDLIKESIIEQINDPISTNMNYIDVIVDKCTVFKETYGDDPEITNQINSTLANFFEFIINKIDDKFNLGLDVNGIISSEDVVEIGTALYTYFVLRYIKNISKFITKYIMKNKKVLADEFTDNNKKDVSTLAYKKQLKDKDDLTIITNLNTIIKYIIRLEIEPEEFIELSTGSDN